MSFPISHSPEDYYQHPKETAASTMLPSSLTDRMAFPLPSTYQSPFIDLGPDLFRKILSHICNESLDGTITADAYRFLLPFAVCSQHHYILTLSNIRGLALLPVNFQAAKSKQNNISKVPPFPIALLPSPSPLNSSPSASSFSLNDGDSLNNQIHHSQAKTPPSIYSSASASASTSTVRSPSSATPPRSPSPRRSPLSCSSSPDPRLSDRLPPAVAHLPSLRSLHLFRNSEICDEALRAIALSAPNLIELRLRAIRTLTPTGLRALVLACPSLQLLDLSYCHNLSAESCAQLFIPSSLPNLKTLQLAYWPLSDAALHTIVSPDDCKIETLDLTACAGSITYNGCGSLQKNNSISTLRLRSSHSLDDDCLYSLSHPTLPTSLQHLDMALMRHISDKGIQHITRNLNVSMQSLNLSHCIQLTDSTAEMVSDKFPNLKALDISYCHRLTDTSITFFASGLQYLESIDLSGLCHISDSGINHFISRLPWLKRISISKCATLTDDVVHILADKSLEFIDLRKCFNISKDALHYLSKHCTQLQHS